MESYILSLDCGTTSCRAILFNKQGAICSMAQKEFTQHFPKPGWVEHDPEEIWSKQLAVTRAALLQIGATASQISAMGITNQRETTVVWNKKTGVPIYNAIVWQCRRTSQYCDQLKEQGLVETFRKKTGLVVDPYFSGTKLHWILEQVPHAKEHLDDLLFGTIDTWLIWKLTDGASHVTDYSNASRTMLYNINTLEWDDEILAHLEIPKHMLPEVRPSSSHFGDTLPSYFGSPIPITGVAGDQQAALFGQTCFSPGDVKNTYGTGSFLLMNTGHQPVYSEHGLVTTIAWGLGDTVTYALEGSIFTTGAAIQWLRDEMGLLTTASDSEYLAQKVEDTGGCYVVPALAGLGAPHWDQYARGAIVGLSRGVNKYHIIRATLDGICYQVCDVIEAMVADAKVPLTALKVDGGASANNYLMQTQSNLIDAPVHRPQCIETTAMGAAYLAGLAVGYWKDLGDIRQNWSIHRSFTPAIPWEERAKRLAGWRKAIDHSFHWAD